MNERLNRATAREIITVPPHGEPQSVCGIWPHCECEADCVAGGDRRRAVRVAKGLAVAAILIGAGLVVASLQSLGRFNWLFFGAMTASVSFEAWLVRLVLP
ncbi:MAG: hypothetical protein E5W76_10875 [Mesorhizobium sp.]|nr:MAG: hypothetical protein E5W76_10875 [Mesorhizobium sp.]